MALPLAAFHLTDASLGLFPEVRIESHKTKFFAIREKSLAPLPFANGEKECSITDCNNQTSEGCHKIKCSSLIHLKPASRLN